MSEDKVLMSVPVDKELSEIESKPAAWQHVFGSLV